MSPAHPPALTSTPYCAPPAPPPPPPPLPPPASSETSSVVELVHKRRKNEKDHGRGRLKPREAGLGNSGVPSMLDVLKDLKQVKLRSVKR